jgi:hypothetical protein
MKDENPIAKLQNRWHNVYWFARMLISRDQYAEIGKRPKLLATLASSLRLVATENKGEDTLVVQKCTLRNILENTFQKAKSKKNQLERLLNKLDEKIKNQDDMNVFIMTCENIMLPLNQAIMSIPNDDKVFTQNIARAFLDKQGESALSTVISLWDDLGTEGCLTAERVEIVRAFTTLRILLDNDCSVTKEDADIILSAFAQEFERRAAQKRKRRAGGSLEDVTSFILNYYGIKQAEKPEHFQADIEIDNWVKTKDNWLIGISCKRTLRERWKQVSSADAHVLSKFKIKYIFHVVTFDEDLSDEKLSLLGGLRHIFYLPDNSLRLANASKNIGLQDYVRPISKFVSDIRAKLTGK